MALLKKLSLLVAATLLASCADPVALKDPPKQAAKDPPAHYSHHSPTPSRVKILAPTVSGTVNLVWDANPSAENVTSYNVYKVMPKTVTHAPYWLKINSSPVPSITLADLPPGGMNVYAVTAVNQVEGGMSGAIPARTP